MAEGYIIQSTRPTTYLDERGKVTKGFTIYFYLPEFDEYHEIDVPSLNSDKVKKSLEAFVSNRRALGTI